VVADDGAGACGDVEELLIGCGDRGVRLEAASDDLVAVGVDVEEDRDIGRVVADLEPAAGNDAALQDVPTTTG
jgi:hypothetical protein